MWTCHITGGTHEPMNISPETLVDEFGDHASRYWRIHSDGRYQVSLVEGKAVEMWLGAGGTPEDRAGKCREVVRKKAEKRSGPSISGVVIVTTDSRFPPADPPDLFGNVEADMPCNTIRLDPRCEYTYPENQRDAIIIYPNIPSFLPVLIHEMGHTLGFPHSYTSLAHGGRGQYDNLMDIMSGGSDFSFAEIERDGDDVSYPLAGMIAVNRCTAGWIPPDQVHVYQGGTLRLTLRHRGNGTLMLAIPSEQAGLWLSLGYRQKAVSYDDALSEDRTVHVTAHDDAPIEGVEVYEIDERPTACQSPQRGACGGVTRRVTPYPSDPNDTSAHVLNVGDQITWGGVAVWVGPTRNSIVIKQWWIPPYGYPYW